MFFRKSSRPKVAKKKLRFESLEDRRLLAPIADIADVQPDPRITPVGLVSVTFNEPVTGVDRNDFRLTRDGTNVSLALVPFSGSGAAYDLDLSTVTNVSGTYALSLVASGSGIANGSNEVLVQDAEDIWVINDTVSPTANIVDIAPDPRNTAVGSVTITFSEAVTGVDINDFSLTRDGTVVSLTEPNELEVGGSGASYTLNLSSVTSASGTYVLKLVAANSDIRDSALNLLTADADDEWTTDSTAPTAGIGEVTPDPRTTPVGNVTITFSESVTGVNIADFTLTRNGTPVSLTGLTVVGSGANYTLNLSSVTVAAGTYVLTLVAAGSGIVDSLGNPLSGNASETWVNDTTAPTADIVDITPDPRTTPVGNVTINFSEPVTGVDIADFRLTRNGTPVSLAGLTVMGSGATYTLDLTTVTATFGTYVLTLVAAGSGITDSVGNAMTANASDTWSADDAFEQNDTLAKATELGRLKGPVTLSSLGLVDANDWYRFTTTKTGGVSNSVSITFQNANGNLDLQLYNVSGQLLKSSVGNGNTEKISLSGRKAGTYFIRVYGKAGAINTSYSLNVNAPSTLLKTTAVKSTAAIDALLTDGSWANGKRRT